jgi:hypothetical protein
VASVSAIRDGLKTRLATVPGLRAHDVVPDVMNPPAAIVQLEDISFDATMGRGSDRLTFTVTLFVSNAWNRTAQDNLDAYLAGEGASSIKAAIEADETLASVVSFAWVMGVRNYGDFEFAGQSYYGAEFVIEVMT